MLVLIIEVVIRKLVLRVYDWLWIHFVVVIDRIIRCIIVITIDGLYFSTLNVNFIFDCLFYEYVKKICLV